MTRQIGLASNLDVATSALESRRNVSGYTYAQSFRIKTKAVDKPLVTTTLAPNGTPYLRGTLRADCFRLEDAKERRTVISGNGNIDYGCPAYGSQRSLSHLDYLDLSHLPVSSMVGWSRAGRLTGELFDAGSGHRVFDILQLSDGRTILYEGLDAIQFSDKIFYLSVHPNDPLFSKQWNLHVMGVQNAWRFTKGSRKVLIGVQDTGLGRCPASQRFHSALRKSICFEHNIEDNGLSSPTHGTGVQSIIGAISNNRQGMCGINWHSDIYTLDVIGHDSGDYSIEKATELMIERARRYQQKLIINMSLAGKISNRFESLVAKNQIDVLFVVAAGNRGQDGLDELAALGKYYRNVLTVGAAWGTQNYFGQATQPGDRIHYRNSKHWSSSYGDGLAIMGPSEVLAATVRKFSKSILFNYELKFRGTSAAAPNVSGVASLVWDCCHKLSAIDVHQILTSTAFDLGPSGYDLETGCGFVDADAAVRRAIAMNR